MRKIVDIPRDAAEQRRLIQRAAAIEQIRPRARFLLRLPDVIATASGRWAPRVSDLGVVSRSTLRRSIAAQDGAHFFRIEVRRLLEDQDARMIVHAEGFFGGRHGHVDQVAARGHTGLRAARRIGPDAQRLRRLLIGESRTAPARDTTRTTRLSLKPSSPLNRADRIPTSSGSDAACATWRRTRDCWSASCNRWYPATTPARSSFSGES